MTGTGLSADVLVIGGGVGGVAAALAALERGLTVVLTEEFAWIGGQLTVQGTPPDEHPWIEAFGCTATYRRFRDGVRQYYRDRFALTPSSRARTQFNPGNATVSKLACSPAVAHAVLRGMLEPHIQRGALTLRTETEMVACAVNGDSVGEVEFVSRATGDRFVVSARYVIDATELGDVLELAGVEHVTGAESQAQTGEPSAPAVADPANMQAFTWVLAMGYDPTRDHTIDRPEGYDHWRRYRPPFWPDDYLSLSYPEPRTLAPTTAPFVPHFDGPGDLIVADQSRPPQTRNFWAYRRIHWRHAFEGDAAGSDVVIMNWPMNDYLEGPLFGAPAEEVARHLEASRELTLSLFYWLQTEAPRPDGGTGWPGLHLRGDVLGTGDGFAMGPYVREARRIQALRTVVEQDISVAVRGPRAVRYDDTVGIGAYRIDLHPSTGGDNYIDVASAPFQIPLGALVPVRVRNVIPASKNIGTTHITNGCYRVHPVEWNIGEAAGALAAYCIANDSVPQGVAGDARAVDDLQRDLVRGGVELEWPAQAYAY